DVCRHGVLLCAWLNNEVRSLVDEPVAVSVVIDDFMKTRPNLVIPGFGFDITIADLFCIRGLPWLNDATMGAFCVFLITYKNNSTVTIPPAKKTPPKKPAKAEPVLVEQELQQVRNGLASRQFVLMPINLSGAHWVCLVVNGTSKKIKLIDSMGLKTIAAKTVAALPETCDKIIVNGHPPLQQDGDSCDVFACLLLWNSVSIEAPTDVSKSDISKLRWEFRKRF
ncbi:hypothetical protein L914_09104, partial [Phytophthora nicotianae]